MVEGDGSIPKYAKGLLKLALSKIPEKYEWDDSTATNTEARIIQMVVENQLDVCWYATTNEFEERMQPIRIPMYRGLLGYRVLMIKKGTQSKFDGIRTLEDLRRVSLGSGRFWADTDVLLANNLNVVKVLKYEGMFFMLDGDRFDAFPRGAHEPWAEMKRHPKLDLEVEKNLLMIYPNPFYFFVNKSNNELAKNIEKGLRIAIEDGSFEEYFMNDPTVKDVIANANLKSRTVIKLQNPTLPKLTPLDDKTLWFDPFSLDKKE
ncbi:hypothetical protein GCM10011613_05480 [Cellvibrio zantedeschiae]|uniref:Diguanylate cyclase n=2 Tax=Cellvibrio zantedeschiae TaxID=1237077 RepID=A0ABQ3ART8_9GAMM|nr:hypothetical protein GCM10011613_05480 [Cellvibrio zantedeschiae]